MTRKEFENLRAEIQQQKFTVTTDCHPLRYATERAAFRADQLRRLIEIGRTIKDSKTVQRKVERWERQIERLKGIPERMARLDPIAVRVPSQPQLKA